MAVAEPIQEVVQTVKEVVWEVEVETEVMARLKGAFVGFLAEPKELLDIQHRFILEGYHNIKVTLIGHLKVLLTSSVVGEVQEVVGTVGWWCTWFDRFEEWSPESVSNQRTTWLRCYGVPHHAWGEALFRALGFKFGNFVEMDSSTTSMLRLDVARIKIITDKLPIIDSTMVVSVLDKKFVIRVIEEGGEAVGIGGWRCDGRCEGWHERTSSRGSADGGSVMAVVEGSSEGDGDGDWSDHGQVLLGVGSLGVGRKGQEGVTRLKELQGKEGSEVDPNFLGIFLTDDAAKANHEEGNILAASDGSRVDGDLLAESERMLENVSLSPGRPRDTVGREREIVGSGLLPGLGENGAGCTRPIFLRTKDGDLPLVGPVIEKRGDPKDKGGVSSEVLVSGGIGLVVTLPAEGGKEGTIYSPGRRGVEGAGRVGVSGVAVIVGEEPSNSIGSPLTGEGSVDKDRCDAHHIIDIQDDLGMNFNGDKEVVVNRILMFEERDRREKSVWEQEHSQ
ncbi:DUF4283 domain protein [Trifolium medium]|uniref:DUF4283 domain protein n=1 Tax=Trifolium medium TaxID=97028 RepID=A0A392MDK3_9FABA|nr:DUF4283 domain protein [Trifolium medium]